MPTDLTRLVQGLLLDRPALRDVRWQPAADVYRTRSGWIVKIDLAGVRPADVRVSVCGRRLTVEGTRRDWQIEDAQQHYCMEIAYSHFERSIELPCDLDRFHVTTDYRDGMLLVRLAEEAGS